MEPDCIAQLLSSLELQPASVQAPAIRDIDGDDDYGCGARLIDAALRIRWLRPSARDSLYPLPIVPGGCFALSRATFNRVGGFGHFRELGLEDVDFSLRAWRMGVDMLAVPTAQLAHRFRPHPPYRISSASRAYNVARVALIHLDAERREECLRTIIGTPRAAEVLVDAFVSDWEDQRDHLDANCARSMHAYFDRFGDWR